MIDWIRGRLGLTPRPVYEVWVETHDGDEPASFTTVTTRSLRKAQVTFDTLQKHYGPDGVVQIRRAV